MKETRPELQLVVQYAVAGDDLPDRGQVRRWVKAAQELPLAVTIRFVGTTEGRRLNRSYRGKDYATNVLTFVYEDAPVSGDLVICLPVVRREARQQRKPVKAHLAHMVVHGMLHLQGYDHERNTLDAERMEARERAILARFRIPDPYA